MKPLTLLALVAALTYLGAYTAAAVLTVPLAFLAGRKTAIRENGASMVKTGGRRLVTGRF